MPWDVLRVGRFKSWSFSDGTFLEWDVSRAGPFVCAPHIQYNEFICRSLNANFPLLQSHGA